MAGLAAAWIEARPGLPIGVGGRPMRRRVLKSESMFSSDSRSALLQLFSAIAQRRVDAERDALLQAVVDDRRDEAAVLGHLGLALDHRGDDEHVVAAEVLARARA